MNIVLEFEKESSNSAHIAQYETSETLYVINLQTFQLLVELTGCKHHTMGLFFWRKW